MSSDLEGIFGKYVSLLIALLIITLAGSCAHSKYEISRLIEGGVEPLEARCALSPGQAQSCRPLYYK